MNNLDEKLTIIHNDFKVSDDIRYKKLAEECAEYLESYFNGDISKMLNEAADVHNVVRGLLLNSTLLNKYANAKADRTIDRLNRGYYNEI